MKRILLCLMLLLSAFVVNGCVSVKYPDEYWEWPEERREEWRENRRLQWYERYERHRDERSEEHREHRREAHEGYREHHD